MCKQNITILCNGYTIGMGVLDKIENETSYYSDFESDIEEFSKFNGCAAHFGKDGWTGIHYAVFKNGEISDGVLYHFDIDTNGNVTPRKSKSTNIGWRNVF